MLVADRVGPIGTRRRVFGELVEQCAPPTSRGAQVVARVGAAVLQRVELGAGVDERGELIGTGPAPSG